MRCTAFVRAYDSRHQNPNKCQWLQSSAITHEGCGWARERLISTTKKVEFCWLLGWKQRALGDSSRENPTRYNRKRTWAVRCRATNRGPAGKNQNFRTTKAFCGMHLVAFSSLSAFQRCIDRRKRLSWSRSPFFGQPFHFRTNVPP